MKIFTTCAILAPFIATCWASAPVRTIEARQVPVVEFFFEGALISVAQGYGNFTITVPEDGSKFPITNSMEVYSIIPSDEDSDCIFVGADGTVIRILGGQRDIIPQPLTSVTCLARSGPVVTPTGFPNFTSFFPNLQTVATTASATSAIAPSTTKSVLASTTPPSGASTGGSTVPPYLTGRGTLSKAGTAAASASAPSGAASATGGLSTSAIVPFTGDAVRATKSIGGFFLALVGLIVAL